MDGRQPPGEWNPGSLHQHFDHLLEQLERNLRDLVEAQEAQRQRAFADLQAQIDRRIDVTERERSLTENHLKALIQAGDEKLTVHANAQRDAIQEASRVLDKRLESMNKFREEVTNDRLMFMRKDEVEAKLDAVKVAMGEADKNWNRRFDAHAERITEINNQMIERRGGEQYERRRQTQTQPWQIWAAGGVLAILLFIAGSLIQSPFG